MRTCFAAVIVVATLCFLTSTDLLAASPTCQTQTYTSSAGPNSVATPAASAMLKTASDIAQQGDALGGFDRAKDAKQLGAFDSATSVEYLNTLLTIIEHADHDQKGAIVNEAISTIDQLRKNIDFSGEGNPQTAYFFMVATGKLADVSLSLNETTYIHLKKYSGKIARSLGQNPNYPADGRNFLADPLAELATALAIANNMADAKVAMTEANQWGFAGYDKLVSSPLLERVQEKEQFVAHVEGLHQQYRKSLKAWSAKEIRDFQPFRFACHLEDVTGGTVSTNDFDGHILVIDLWATWCPPCRETLPNFQQLGREYHKSGVRVLGISMDSPDDPASSINTVKAFLNENNFDFACGMGTADLKSTLPADLKLPTTLFVDRSGAVRYMATGSHDFDKMAAITEALLSEKQPVQAPAQRDPRIE